MGLKKSKNYRTALKTADTWFSRYIRVRDANQQGRCKCITCNKVDTYKAMDAGHFISRRYLSTRFDDQNVHAQCVRCNQYGSGEQYIHALEIDLLYGVGTKDAIYAKSKELIKYTKQDLMDLARIYKQKYIEACESKGLQIDYK